MAVCFTAHVVATLVVLAGITTHTAATPGEGASSQRLPEKSFWTPTDVFDHEVRLRKEMASLMAEAAWLRQPGGKSQWSDAEAFLHLEPFQREIATLRQEIAWLHRERQIQAAADFFEEVKHDSDPRPLVPNDAKHGEALFVTMCAGAVYFDTYCGPFLASFERAYGSAVGTKHRVVVFFASVEPGMIQAANSRFRPWVEFVALSRGGLTGEGEEHYNSTITGNSDTMVCEIGEGKIVSCNVTSEGVENRGEKVNRNNFWFPFHVADYIKEHNSEGFCYVVLIDSDTLIVRPVGPFLPPCKGKDVHGRQYPDWDVAFTAYDPQFTAPWASENADVGRTQRGFSRINTGVVLLSLRDPALVGSFLARWAEVTTWLHGAGDEALGKGWEGHDKQQWEFWNKELLVEFKGPNQASLALLLCSYQVNRLPAILGWGHDCGACNHAVDARLELLDGEAPLLVKFRALPARVLNHPESMPGGSFSPELRIVHLKGLWWRTSLPRGATFLMDDFRRSNWNRDSLVLHRLSYETWQAALPPEARPSGRFMVKDSEGRAVSRSELQEVLDL